MVNRAEDEVMAILGEPQVIPVILLLSEREARDKGIVQSAITDRIKGRSAVTNTLKRLEDLGVVKVQITNMPRRTIIYQLTDKGMKMVEPARQLRAIAQEG